MSLSPQYIRTILLIKSLAGLRGKKELKKTVDVHSEEVEEQDEQENDEEEEDDDDIESDADNSEEDDMEEVRSRQR